MAHHHDQQVPRGALIAAAALILLAIALAALSRQGFIGRADSLSAPTVVSRDLVFLDRKDGGILVLAAETGETVQSIEPGTNGFLRGVLRGLARERRLGGFDTHKPFRLLRQGDGRLTLVDLATDRHIELVSFGPTNARAFARFLTASEEKS